MSLKWERASDVYGWGLRLLIFANTMLVWPLLVNFRMFRPVGVWSYLDDFIIAWWSLVFVVLFALAVHRDLQLRETQKANLKVQKAELHHAKGEGAKADKLLAKTSLQKNSEIEIGLGIALIPWSVIHWSYSFYPLQHMPTLGFMIIMAMASVVSSGILYTAFDRVIARIQPRRAFFLSLINFLCLLIWFFGIGPPFSLTLLILLFPLFVTCFFFGTPKEWTCTVSFNKALFFCGTCLTIQSVSPFSWPMAPGIGLLTFLMLYCSVMLVQVAFATPKKQAETSLLSKEHLHKSPSSNINNVGFDVGFGLYLFASIFLRALNPNSTGSFWAFVLAVLAFVLMVISITRMFLNVHLQPLAELFIMFVNLTMNIITKCAPPASVTSILIGVQLGLVFATFSIQTAFFMRSRKSPELFLLCTLSSLDALCSSIAYFVTHNPTTVTLASQLATQILNVLVAILLIIAVLFSGTALLSHGVSAATQKQKTQLQKEA